MTITFQQMTESGLAPSAVEMFQFPGGEWHLRVPAQEVVAPARVTGCDVNDIALLGLWADWVHSTGQRSVAHLPYLPAARADRGVPFGAQVYAQLINSIGLDEVVVFDPHSPVAPGLIRNVRIVESTDLICDRVIPAGGYAAVIAPDEGAIPRAQRVAERAGIPLLTATKSRDFDTGQLLGFRAPEEFPAAGRVLIVDDICDGGGTFMGLADALGASPDRLDLWVSHGIFSGNAQHLRTRFHTIWTTDSHDGARNPAVGANVIELDTYLR